MNLCIVKIENEKWINNIGQNVLHIMGTHISILTYKGRITCYQVTGVIQH